VRPLRAIAWRVALGVVAAWGVMTAVFALFTLTEDWVLKQEIGLLRWGGTEEEVVEAVREE